MKNKIIIFVLIILVLGMLFILTINHVINKVSNTLDVSNQNLLQTNTTLEEESFCKQYTVGETYKNNDLSIKFLSFNETFTGYKEDDKIDDGFNVLKAEFEHECLSEESQNFIDKTFTIVNLYCIADDVCCSLFLWKGFEAPMSCGNKTITPVYFQVPKEATSIKLIYTPNINTDEHIEFKVK